MKTLDYLLNTQANSPARSRRSISRCAADAAAEVETTLRAVFDYEPGPLVALPTLAAKLGIGCLHIKDEGRRLGLRSFKALGGAYAVLRLIMEQAAREYGAPIPLAALPRAASGSLAPAHRNADDTPYPGASKNRGGAQRTDGPAILGNADCGAEQNGVQDAAVHFRRAAAATTFVCATDGNHGQSVAAGARLAGARAVILVHEGVSRERRDAIARFGAEVIEIAGTYDDAVAASMRLAQEHDWTLLSDTSWPGYEDVPLWVMQGYTLIAGEARQQLPGPPTHVFLQAGVGGFAAALASAMGDQWSSAPPQFIIVEPTRAACLYASALAGKAMRIAAGEPTLMSMLECHEPSHLAWDCLRTHAAAFMAVEDRDAVAAMRALALAEHADEVVLSGESGAAGLAGLMTAAADEGFRKDIGLDSSSRVLLVNTESATDECRFTTLVGIPPADVANRAQAARRIPRPRHAS
jgi:diaminopropionate ammonia-lyase